MQDIKPKHNKKLISFLKMLKEEKMKDKRREKTTLHSIKK